MADIDWIALWWDYGFPVAIILGKSLLLLVALLMIIAFLLLADRKIWAAVMLRRGPNVVGPYGLLQSFADFLKFVLKEPVIPGGADKVVFLLAPLATTVLALSAWAVIPVADGWAVANLNVGILYLLAISSLGVYGIIMGGWASNSKYPFLGSLRSAAQMVSYEVSIGFVIVTVLLCAGSLNLNEIVAAQKSHGLATLLGVPWLTVLNWYWLPLFPMMVVFFISALAETNRPPFDLAEAEFGDRGGLHGGILLDALSTVHAGRVCLHRADVRADHHPLPWRLAASGRRGAVHLGARRRLVHDQGLRRLLHVRDGEDDRAALPLRPAHAAGLEGAAANLACRGRRGCRVFAVRCPVNRERGALAPKQSSQKWPCRFWEKTLR